MRVAFDSNVLVYAAGIDRAPGDAAKIEVSRRLLTSIGSAAIATGVIPVQTVGELGIAALRAGMSRAETAILARGLSAGFLMAPSNWSTMEDALALMSAHKLQLWDSVIICAAAEAGCTLLLSEDMQSGFKWRSLTVVNPFGDMVDPRLRRLLAS